jgi:hypothetical protein
VLDVAGRQRRLVLDVEALGDQGQRLVLDVEAAQRLVQRLGAMAPGLAPRWRFLGQG